MLLVSGRGIVGAALLSGLRCFGGGNVTGGSLAAVREAFGNGSMLHGLSSSPNMGEHVSIPSGLRVGSAYKSPLRPGGLASRGTSGAATTTAAIRGEAKLSGSAAGIATVSVNAHRGISRSGSSAGIATTAAAIRGEAHLSASLVIGTITQDDVTGALLEAQVENGLTVKQVLRIILAVAAGKASGGGSATVTFRDTGDITDRVTATVDANGNRTAVTLDAS